MAGDLRDPHGEGGLVDVLGGRVGVVQGELGASFAQAGFVLRRGVDGDGEDLACVAPLLLVWGNGGGGGGGRRTGFEHLLRRGDPTHAGSPA